MNYGQIINTIFFFKNVLENGAERVFPDLFLFFKKSFKALSELSVNGLQLSFTIFQ